MSEPIPVSDEDVFWIATGEPDGVEAGEGAHEDVCRDQRFNLGGASALTVGDGNADAPHDFVIVWNWRARAKLATRKLGSPGRGGSGFAAAKNGGER